MTAVTSTTAAVWRGESGIRLESIDVPPLSGGDALVRVRLATLCGSDRHTVLGHRQQPFPSILGHETVGEIVATGAGVARSVGGDSLAVGDRVIWSVTLPCGSCDRCARGMSAKCRTVRKAGHEALTSSWALSGGYAEHALLPAGLPIAVVPAGLPDSVAAPAARATATVMAAARQVPRLHGATVVVVGAGMLGLTALSLARSRDAARVIAIDPSDERRMLALRFGATDAASAILNLGDVDIDVLFDFAGAIDPIRSGMERLAVGGTLVLAGSVSPTEPLALDPERIVRNLWRIVGVHNYEPGDLVDALAFLETSDHPWHELVADPARLAEVENLLRTPPGSLPRYSVAPSESAPRTWASSHPGTAKPPQLP